MHVRHNIKTPTNLIKRAIYILKSRASQRPLIAIRQNKSTHKQIVIEGTLTPQITTLNSITQPPANIHQTNQYLLHHPSISQLLNCQIMRNIRSRTRILPSKTPNLRQQKTPRIATSRNSCCIQRGFNYDTLLPLRDRRCTYTITNDISAW